MNHQYVVKLYPDQHNTLLTCAYIQRNEIMQTLNSMKETDQGYESIQDKLIFINNAILALKDFTMVRSEDN